MTNPRVTSVKPLPDYKVLLGFSNGEQGVYDFTKFLDRGVFRELRDEQYFQKVSVWKSAGTIHWPNGQDLCPDTLYLDSKKDVVFGEIDR